MEDGSLHTNAKGYLGALKETLGVSRWVTIDMITPELTHWWVRFLFWLTLAIGLGALLPLAIGRVITFAS